MQRLDLSGLETFKASALLEDATGKPLELPLDAIDFDPKQPRRHVLAETLAELAETIKTDGVLQPISVRPHPEHKERYVINHGERRDWQASRPSPVLSGRMWTRTPRQSRTCSAKICSRSTWQRS